MGDDFDQRVLGQIQEDEPVRARVITMRHRLMPLFKAAAVVAIFLTLGNAMQVAVSDEDAHQVKTSGVSIDKPQEGPSVLRPTQCCVTPFNNKIQPPVSTITK